MIKVRSIGLSMVFVLTLCTGFAQSLINLDEDGVIIQGYDPVEYFNSGSAIKGNGSYQSQYNGAKYNFKSAENKNEFDSNPEKYEVQFGGFCAYAVSQGHVSPIDPKFCSVQKDANGVERLICQHNQKATDLWNKQPDALLVDAYTYWPRVIDNRGRQIKIKGVAEPLININIEGLAIEGYDVVAYHTEGKAIKGDARFTEFVHGAKYQFSSKENLESFRADFKKYLPAYGGFCGYAASINRVSIINPEIFQIENGRLILQHTQEAYDLFNKDAEGNIKKADHNWPLIEKKNAKHKVHINR